MVVLSKYDYTTCLIPCFLKTNLNFPVKSDHLAALPSSVENIKDCSENAFFFLNPSSNVFLLDFFPGILLLKSVKFYIPLNLLFISEVCHLNVGKISRYMLDRYEAGIKFQVHLQSNICLLHMDIASSFGLAWLSAHLTSLDKCLFYCKSLCSTILCLLFLIWAFSVKAKTELFLWSLYQSMYLCCFLCCQNLWCTKDPSAPLKDCTRFWMCFF